MRTYLTRSMLYYYLRMSSLYFVKHCYDVYYLFVYDIYSCISMTVSDSNTMVMMVVRATVESGFWVPGSLGHAAVSTRF